MTESHCTMSAAANFTELDNDNNGDDDIDFDKRKHLPPSRINNDSKYYVINHYIVDVKKTTTDDNDNRIIEEVDEDEIDGAEDSSNSGHSGGENYIVDVIKQTTTNDNDNRIVNEVNENGINETENNNNSEHSETPKTKINKKEIKKQQFEMLSSYCIKLLKTEFAGQSNTKKVSDKEISPLE